ncbi:DUF2262 domain-containing protein [Paenibacillus sp. GCM10028914]|uniref:DUF2262 domain-containing protein n=1 Tax=Paenibacillus sp. GCM10028914 TaxID=3273416 RepID=UPI00360D44D9
MELNIRSRLIGIFKFNSDYMGYECKEGKIDWILKLESKSTDVNELINKAETLFVEMDRFDHLAKSGIAEKLIDYKNDFWPEYDENDSDLDWDAVEAGDYDVSKEKFEELINLCFIEIRSNEIYCEYNDGDMFGGHRIHVYLDYQFNVINAEL